MMHSPEKAISRKRFNEGDLQKYFPEDVAPIDVGSVVVHKRHPETTVGFVSRKFRDEEAEYFSKKITDALKIPSEYLGYTNERAEPTWYYEVEWAQGHAPASDLDFSKFVAPISQRVNYPAIAKQIVNVQPMSAPVGGIFYMDYKYPPQDTGPVSNEKTFPPSAKKKKRSRTRKKIG